MDQVLVDSESSRVCNGANVINAIFDVRAEDEIEAAWTAEYPEILGGLLDLAAQVRDVLPDVDAGTDMPRMADFGRRYSACADSATSDSFIARLIGLNRRTADGG